MTQVITGKQVNKNSEIVALPQIHGHISVAVIAIIHDMYQGASHLRLMITR